MAAAAAAPADAPETSFPGVGAAAGVMDIEEARKETIRMRGAHALGFRDAVQAVQTMNACDQAMEGKIAELQAQIAAFNGDRDTLTKRRQMLTNLMRRVFTLDFAKLSSMHSELLALGKKYGLDGEALYEHALVLKDRGGQQVQLVEIPLS